jgi:methyltransferase (TIGR00027 family)
MRKRKSAKRRIFDMNKKQSSATAEGIALVCAIEAEKPEGERICYDPIARSLVNGISFTLSKLVIDSGIYARISRGAVEYITVRERYIDDFLRASLDEGLDQVVILGAGFDTRAYHTAGIEKTRVFEIDHPATQAVKLKRLKKALHTLPNNVTFIPIDFNIQTLDERLPAGGYCAKSKTLFIWQGVTMYLTPEGVDNTLAFIANHSGPGSMVIFDYFYNEALHNDFRHNEMKNTDRILQATGERLRFGIDQGRAEQFLTQRGFWDISNVTSLDLKQLYFSGPNAGRKILTGCAIVSARVKP